MILYYKWDTISWPVDVMWSEYPKGVVNISDVWWWRFHTDMDQPWQYWMKHNENAILSCSVADWAFCLSVWNKDDLPSFLPRQLFEFPAGAEFAAPTGSWEESTQDAILDWRELKNSAIFAENWWFSRKWVDISPILFLKIDSLPLISPKNNFLPGKKGRIWRKQDFSVLRGLVGIVKAGLRAAKKESMRKNLGDF